MRFSSDPAAWRMTVEPDEIHLWSVSLNKGGKILNELEGVLAPEERQRAQSFHFERDRVRFATARGVLRLLLGGYVGGRPKDLEFQYGAQGKPSLAGEKRSPSFSMAHSQDLALYAIRAEGEIGVDVEHVHAVRDWAAIAREYFGAEEYDQLACASSEERDGLFFRYWTLKEAVVKATGEGVGQLKDFRVSWLEGGGALLEGTEINCNWDAGWELKWFEPEAGFAGALAVKGRIGRISTLAVLDESGFASLVARL